MTSNNLKRPITSKKQAETTYNEQEITNNDLQQTNSNSMEFLCLKNNDLEDFNEFYEASLITNYFK